MGPTESADVVFEDSIQALKSVGQGACDPSRVDPPCSVRNGRELLMCMKKSAEQILSETGCHTYVMCFDRYEKVPKAKGAEEASRDDKKTGVGGRGDEEETDGIDGSNADEAGKGKGKKRRSTNGGTPRPVPVIDPNPEDGIGFKDRRPYLTLDDPLPRDWNGAMKDRDDTVRHVVRWLCLRWLGYEGEEVTFSVPKGKRIILNGHELTNEVVDPSNVRWHQKSRASIEDLPICVGTPVPGGEGGITKTVLRGSDSRVLPLRLEVERNFGFSTSSEWKRDDLTLCEDLKNEIGEADFQFFYLHKSLCESFGRSISAHIFSTDTDMLYLSLYHSRYVGLGSDPQIYWRYAPCISWVFRPDADRPWPTEEKWVCVNRLLEDIESGFVSRDFEKQIDETERYREGSNDNNPGGESDGGGGNSVLMKDFSRLRFKVLDVLTCVFAGGGCDYTWGYQGITYDKILEAFLAHGSHIGDLVAMDPNVPHGITIVGDAYAKLIVVSYLMGKKQLRDFPIDVGVPEIERRLNKIGPKNRFPDEDGMYGMMYHLLYYLKMIRQIHSPDLTEPDPETYGFRAKDPNEPISRTNVVMTLES